MSHQFENDWLYNLVHNKEPDNKEVAFYQKQITRFGKPVLELGSETGNFLVTVSDDKLNQSEAHTIFSGSIHKFFNDNILENNKGNSNDYNYDQLCSSIDILDSKLKINFKEYFIN